MAASTSIVRATSADLNRFSITSRNAEQITRVLQEAKERCNLVSPAVSCGPVPQGFSVKTTALMLPNDNRHTYKQDSGLSLTALALHQLATLTGVSARWSRCKRANAERTFEEWEWCGTYKDFSGDEQTLLQSYALDLREGSSKIKGLTQKNIDQMRANISTRAETGAKSRAFCSMGVPRHGYKDEDFLKPFVAVRIHATGDCDDPSLRAKFAEMKFAAALHSSSVMYSLPTSAPPRIESQPAYLEAPPIESVTPDGEIVEDSTSQTVSQPDVEKPAPYPVPPPPVKSTTRQTRPNSPAPSTSGEVHRMRFGRSKGQMITEVPDSDLDWYAEAVAGSVNDPSKSRFRADNEALLGTVRAEQRRRQGGGGASEQEPFSGMDDIPF